MKSEKDERIYCSKCKKIFYKCNCSNDYVIKNVYKGNTK